MIPAVIITAMLIALFIRVTIKEKQRLDIIKSEFERPVELPQITIRNAVVTDKRIEMEKIDIYSHRLIYKVAFLTEHSNTETYSVTEEQFNICDIGQRGTLATVNGDFFDFGNGEPI